jgi:hypothetical protein
MNVGQSISNSVLKKPARRASIGILTFTPGPVFFRPYAGVEIGMDRNDRRSRKCNVEGAKG